MHYYLKWVLQCDSAYDMLGKDVETVFDIHYPLGKCSRTLFEEYPSAQVYVEKWLRDRGLDKRLFRRVLEYVRIKLDGTCTPYPVKLQLDYIYVGRAWLGKRSPGRVNGYQDIYFGVPTGVPRS